MESTEKSSRPSSFVGFLDNHFHIVRSFISGPVLLFLECFCLYFSKWLEGKWGSIFLSLRWENCIGSDWDNFHHSNPHNAVLYVGGCKGVDNTPEFWVMLSIASTASALSLQHSSLPPPSISRLEMSKILEVDRTGPPDQINEMDIPPIWHQI